MTTDYFLNIFNYDTTINQQILEQLKNTKLKVDKAQPIYKAQQIHSHILATKQVWIRRLNNQDLNGIEIWPKFTVDQAQTRIDENWDSYRAYLSNLSDTDLTTNLHYQNSQGTTFKTPIRDILNHVLIHGGHHRGQIAKYVRKAGDEPLNTDYITYIRKQ